MKKILILLVLSLMIAIMSSSEKMLIAETTIDGEHKDNHYKAQDKQPVIFFDNPDFDFGKMFKGEKVEHIYAFENRGDEVLEISRVKTTCGCTAAMVTDKILQPGERGEIKALYNPGSFTGKVKKSLIVMSNDPDSPHYKLTLSGKVEEELRVSPKSINFGSTYLGKEVVKTVTVASLPGSNLTIKKVSSSHPSVHASIAEKRGEEYIVTVVVKDNLEIGRFSGGINIETDSKRQPRVTVPFTGEIAGDLTTYPKRIYYGSVVEGKEVNQKLFVKVHNKDTKILTVKVSPEFLSARIEERYETDNPHCIIEITINKEATIGKLNGILELATNSEKQPMIKIPIQGEVRKG
ncbi:MAG: DUF1573 domain-containing protein [Candidatus Scalindua sp.]|nr:DUF1573 domain-containing protein [Candidatus Scalindua sp.]